MSSIVVIVSVNQNEKSFHQNPKTLFNQINYSIN